MAAEICLRLKLSNDERERVEWLVEKHQILADARQMRTSKLKTLLAHPGIRELLALHRADALASGRTDDHVEYCEQLLREWTAADLEPAAAADRPRPEADGPGAGADLQAAARRRARGAAGRHDQDGGGGARASGTAAERVEGRRAVIAACTVLARAWAEALASPARRRGPSFPGVGELVRRHRPLRPVQHQQPLRRVIAADVVSTNRAEPTFARPVRCGRRMRTECGRRGASAPLPSTRLPQKASHSKPSSGSGEVWPWEAQFVERRVMRDYNSLCRRFQASAEVLLQFRHDARGELNVVERPAHEVGVVVAAARETFALQAMFFGRKAPPQFRRAPRNSRTS